MYEITKTFTSGLLKGLTIAETTKVEFEVGKTYKPCAGSASYKIISCKKLENT